MVSQDLGVSFLRVPILRFILYGANFRVLSFGKYHMKGLHEDAKGLQVARDSQVCYKFLGHMS